MFTNVLVPVDGAPFGEHAIPWALAAAGDRAAIRLVHVHVPPAPMMVEGVVVADPTLDQTLRAQEATYLDDLTHRVRTAAPALQIDAWNLDTDDPVAEALVQAVADTGADLVVMTTHGRGPFARLWLGSTSDDFARVSPVPVLFHHPPPGPVDFTIRPKVDRVIIPLDGSDLAGSIVDPAVRFGKALGAEFLLLFVLDANEDADTTPQSPSEGATDTAEKRTPFARAEHYLEDIAQRIAERGGKAHTRVVRAGTPAEAVLAAAAGQSTTAVAMATHGRSGITRLLMGSATDAVIRDAVGPVLVHHPAG